MKTAKQVFTVTVDFSNTDFGEVERSESQEFFNFEEAVAFPKMVAARPNTFVTDTRVVVSVQEEETT